MHLKPNTRQYEVYEKVSSLPRRLVFTNTFDGNAMEWMKLAFTPSKLWLENPRRKLRIEISGIESSHGGRPLLQLNLKREEKRLKRRHATSFYKGAATTDCLQKRPGLCCKYRRNIPIGRFIPWIAVPRVLRAFTCAGDCIVNHRSNITWTLIGQIGRAPIRKPCCVPTAFDPITVLLINKPNTPIKKTVINDLLVRSCGCL